jgi:hypothetical protein
MTDETLADRLAIRDVVENWVIARDSADWDLFRRQWHDDGYMMATWFQGPRDDFIRVSADGFANGVNILHFTGASQATLNAARTRAVSQTRMTILQRGPVHGVLADVACTGRFYDLFAKRDGRWGIVLRQPIYEKDRLDPVVPGSAIEFDKELLGRYPEGYRYLAYLQVQAGYPVKTDMPGLRGPEVEALYARGAAWLAGEDARLPSLAGRLASPRPLPGRAGHRSARRRRPARPRSRVGACRPSRPAARSPRAASRRAG